MSSSSSLFGETALPAAAAEDAAPPSAYTQSLELSGVIGFNGRVPHGLLLHPNDQHLIYPLGSTIVVRDLVQHTQTFLQQDGHDRAVSCLALSRSGKWLASGQVTHMGFPAQVLIWNMETFGVAQRLLLHKGKVQDLAFSPSEKYLATLGGRDDNKLVLWDVASGAAICGATAANETCHTVRFFHHSDFMLVSGGHFNLRVWSFDLPNRKIRPADCQLGQLKRVIHSIEIDDEDKFMYCATATGDLLQVSLGPNLFKAAGPAKKPFQLGVTCVMRTRKGNLVVGAGDGSVALLKRDGLTVARRTQVGGAVTSLVLTADGSHFFVGTAECNQYLVHTATFELELRNTCHAGRIAAVAFPAAFSSLFATCGGPDIRVWNAHTRNELLRIQVPGLSCLCVAFAPDGKSIVSGWDDGKIRAFGPQSGKLLYAIHDAHLGGVTALACAPDGRSLVSGGEGGQVRVWAIERGGGGGGGGVSGAHKMLASLKEHKARVNCIRLSVDSSACVSASSDGSCIVWSLQRFCRIACLFASTQFRAVAYHPDGSQLLTTGTDRKLTYWDAADATPIRILDASQTDALSALDISADGAQLVTAGGDKVVKVFAYDEGVLGARGVGHSGEVTGVVIAPDQRTIVSIGDEGAIFIWHAPKFSIDAQGNVARHREQQQRGGDGGGDDGGDEEERLAQSFRAASVRDQDDGEEKSRAGRTQQARRTDAADKQPATNRRTHGGATIAASSSRR